jgi:hypothetical protein
MLGGVVGTLLHLLVEIMIGKIVYHRVVDEGAAKNEQGHT